MFDIFLSLDTWISLLTLTFLEVVLGIDNIIFISIVVGRLPQEAQPKGRTIGLLFALVFRIILLGGITWIVGLKEPIISFVMPFLDQEIAISGRDLILFGGGLFLLAKSTTEIHTKLEGEEETQSVKSYGNLSRVIAQIVLIDIIFSFDSILTAVGLVKEITVMVIAVILAMVIMLAFAKYISDFVNKHPTVKMLALAFLILVGVMLIVEAFHVHIPKGYIYFAMAFSLGVEMLNMRLRKKTEPVKLRQNELVEEE